MRLEAKRQAKREILETANNVLTYAICTILLLLLLSGCKTLEDKCLDRFPPVTKIEVRETVRTDTLVLPDSWVEYIDTTVCPPNLPDTLLVIKERTRFLPGDTIYTDVICTDTVTIQADAQKVQYLNEEVERLQTELKEARKSAQRMLWLLLGAGVALGAAGYAYLRKSA